MRDLLTRLFNCIFRIAGTRCNKTEHITFATDADGWDKSANQNLLLELSRNPQLSVTGFVPNHTQKQRDHARKLNVEIVRAKDLKKKTFTS